MKAAILLALTAPVSTVAAQTAPSVPAPKPVSSLQQQFDEGSAAMIAGQWQQAYQVYAALETRLTQKMPNSKVLPVVRLRKGIALFHQDKPEAQSIIEAALPQVNPDDSSMRDDRAQAEEILGILAERGYDYPGAVARYRRALSLYDSAPPKIMATRRLAMIGIFVDPQAALADIDAALLMVKGKSQAEKSTLGVLRDLRGRALLNLGRIKEARADLEKAVLLLGGLETRKYDLNDAATRSDAAIAALRANDPDAARQYLAFSGVGQQAKQGFKLGAAIGLPQCGGVGGPKPDDVAVIEFDIQEDGSVGYARPIYFSGDKSAVVAFAKSVSDWYWSPAELKAVDPFFRYQTRVELRCTNVFNRPNAVSLLEPEIDRWLSSKGIKGFESAEFESPSGLAALEAGLAKRESAAGSDSNALLLVLFQLSCSPAVPRDKAEVYARRAFEIASKTDAPPPIQAYLGINYWRFLDKDLKIRENPVRFQSEITALLAKPQIASNSDVAGALRIALFDSFNTTTRTANGRAVLQPLVDQASRPPNDPYRVGALVRLANIEYEAGRVDVARTLFAKSGLSAQQCALVDARPALAKGNITSGDYPLEALQWRFAGWTMVEFDIAADGHTLNQRPVASWPPFVFGEPATANIKKFTYQQSYRPDGGLGCGGQRQTVRYQIPG